MAPSIPDRWIPYKSCGMVIEGTRIICFKVPLKRGVQVRNKDIKEIWDIKALLKKVPNLGAVIDLTNTHRYYDPKELQSAGVLHKKILMPGRIIPPENTVKEFMETIEEFLGNNCVAVQVQKVRRGLAAGGGGPANPKKEDPIHSKIIYLIKTSAVGLINPFDSDSAAPESLEVAPPVIIIEEPASCDKDAVVGVHCTHGLNRTGYMVCRYMRDRLNIPAKEAIKKFEKARGYQIERENYIADLIGDKPLPPDLGIETDLKPVRGKNNISYRTPLNRYEDDTEDHNNSGRFVRKRRFEGNDTGGSRGSKYRKSRSSESDCSDVNRSYDYRYDY